MSNNQMGTYMDFRGMVLEKVFIDMIIEEITEKVSTNGLKQRKNEYILGHSAKCRRLQKNYCNTKEVVYRGVENRKINNS